MKRRLVQRHIQSQTQNRMRILHMLQKQLREQQTA